MHADDDVNESVAVSVTVMFSSATSLVVVGNSVVVLEDSSAVLVQDAFPPCNIIADGDSIGM
jgi:hypothetical protein